MSHGFTPDLALLVGLATDRFPQTLVEAQMAEDVLERELAKLSISDQEQILCDVHGISQVWEDDDPHNLLQYLEQFEATLQQTLSSYSSSLSLDSAYLEAKKYCEEYVTNPNFRLQFLRCERFNVSAAVDMMLQHFEMKRELFGPGEILGRDVRLSDLSQEDMDTLKTGFLQVYPTRDASGRAIMYMSPEYSPDTIDSHSLMRAIFYFIMATLQDEATQKRGVVWVMLNYKNIPDDLSLLYDIYRVEKVLPPKIAGGHYCYTDPSLRPYVSGIQLFSNDQDRFRMRQHLGSYEDIRFALQTFGIPTTGPMTGKDSQWSVTYHHEWLRSQEQREQAQQEQQLRCGSFFSSGSTESSEETPVPLACSDSSSITTTTSTEQEDDPNPSSLSSSSSSSTSPLIIPDRFDVLLGRKRRACEHTGNLRAGHLVLMHWDKYNHAGKYHKTEVSERIVSIIHESGGRFLKWNDEDSKWSVVEDATEKRDKVAHFFRHLRHKRSKQGQTQQQQQQKERQLVLQDDTAQYNSLPRSSSSSPISEHLEDVVNDHSSQEASNET